MDSIKDVVRSSAKVPRNRETPEEGRWTYRPKRCGNINKDEDNSPKTLNNNKKKTIGTSFYYPIINIHLDNYRSYGKDKPKLTPAPHHIHFRDEYVKKI